MSEWEPVDESATILTDGEVVFLLEGDEIYTLQGEWYYIDCPNESGWVFSTEEDDYFIGELDEEDEDVIAE